MQPVDDLGRQPGVASDGATGVSASRKLLHLATALIPAAGWWLGFEAALGLTSLGFALSLAVEGVRRWWPAVNRVLWRLLPHTFRSWEDRRVLGSTWLAIGSLSTLLLFGRDAGGTAVLMMSWGDPLAEVVGRRWGRPGVDKTIIGSLACFLACLLAAFVGVAVGSLWPEAALAGALVATLVERRAPPPDDNLWMPLLAGLAIVLVQWARGGAFVLFPVWH